MSVTIEVSLATLGDERRDHDQIEEVIATLRKLHPRAVGYRRSSGTGRCLCRTGLAPRSR